MNIMVHTVDDAHPFDATGYGTDEHNNLEVMHGEKPLGLFNKEHWSWVEVCE